MVISNEAKRYLISAVDTFIASFLTTFIVIVSPALDDSELFIEFLRNPKSILISAIVGGCVAGLRTTLKAIRESINGYITK